MSALTDAKPLSAKKRQSALGDLGLVAAPDGREALGPKRLHAERHERDPAVVQLASTVSASTSAGLVSMQTSPVTSNRSRTRSSTAATLVQRERRRSAADVDAGDLGRPDGSAHRSTSASAARVYGSTSAWSYGTFV